MFMCNIKGQEKRLNLINKSTDDILFDSKS